MWAWWEEKEKELRNTSKIRRHLYWILKDEYVLTSRAGKKRICRQKQKYRQRNDNGKKREHAGINMREEVYKTLKVGWDYIKILLGNVVQNL